MGGWRRWRAWLGLITAGCIVGLPAAGRAAPACDMKRVASLPLVVQQRLALVEVKINGQPAWMGLDTGTQTTLVTPEAAQRIGLPPDGLRRTTVLSPAGASEVQNVRLNDLLIGDVMFSDLSVAAVRLPDAEPEERPADGLIGSDILSSYDVELDFAGGALNLYEVSDCARVQPPWQRAVTAVRASLTPRRLLALPVQIDGTTVEALFDTGSDRERLARSAAIRAGVSDAALARDPDTEGIAAGGPSHVWRVHRFRLLRIGDESFANPAVEVGSLGTVGADMLLGMDYMRSRRFWLSYTTQTIFIQRPAR